MISIRPASSTEANSLSDLAYTSKAYWGYSSDFMEKCREELTVNPDDCNDGRVFVATDDENLAGFYRLEGMAASGKLADLFVHPDYIGRGVGGELLEHAKETARSLGMVALEIQSDPNADGFYSHMGAVEIGKSPSGSIAGRFLTTFKISTTN